MTPKRNVLMNPSCGMSLSVRTAVYPKLNPAESQGNQLTPRGMERAQPESDVLMGAPPSTEVSSELM